ncbi:hypothetical protein GM415_08855 [Pseudodesulfovibrio cashew]|uniref:Uncharacterized protein n=1 Tax=Pseudodesulfovibrio cashew TaxID=2678688 RepID=A0A6I6JGT6_9BACT|nr:hypothetical protein [Pseudodesulfovibrio cashew]QGY40230.1 hypothetical protein GM415_08855 [Pseudodesulfovibrio cashew]
MKFVEQPDEFEEICTVSLTYCGGTDATNSYIDLYDLSTALNGFHRSLAITGHYLFNDEIITRAPNAKGVRIITSPPVEGSFGIVATILGVATIIGLAPRDTPVGHAFGSLYAQIIFKCTGKQLDYSRFLGQDKIDQVEIETSKLESLAQKVETSVKNIHRPIMTQSALTSNIVVDEQPPITFDSQTLDLTNKLIIDTNPTQFTGRVAGYSANTRSGMIYSWEEKRAIPFELERGIDIDSSVLSKSLGLYDTVKSKHRKGAKSGFFKFLAKKVTNQAGATRKYYITHIYSDSLIQIPSELT